MKYLNDREKKFAEILSDVSFDIDTNELWESLEDKLPAEKKKRRFPFWLFGGLAGVLLIAVSFWLLDPYAETEFIPEELSMTTQTLEDNSVFDRSAALEQTIEKVVATRAENSPQVAPIAEEVIVEKHNSLNNIISAGQHKEVEELPLGTTHQLSSNFVGDDSQIQGKSFLPNLDEKPTSNILTGNQNTLAQSLSISLLGQPDFQPLTITARSIDEPSQDFYTAPIEVLSQKTKWNNYFSFSLGSNLNIPSYSPESIESDILETFKSKERSLPGMTSRLSAGIENGQGWRFFGGLAYTQLVNQYRNFDPKVTAVQFPGTETLEVDAEGTSNPVSGTLTETTTVNYAQNLYRKQNLMDVFVGAGKQFRLRNGWSAGASVSLNYNLFSSTKGYYFTEQHSVVEKIANNSDSEFKKNIGVGSRVQLNIEKELGSNTAIILKPFLASYLNPLNVGTHYTIKNSQFGLSVGITYRPCREQN